MTKTVLLTVLAVVGVLAFTDSAFARGRRGCCGQSNGCFAQSNCCNAAPCAAPACGSCNLSCNTCNTCNTGCGTACNTGCDNACSSGCTAAAPAPVTTAIIPAGPQMAQTNTGSNYQSFSFEPGTPPAASTAPVYTTYQTAPMTYRQSNWSEYNSVLRGDRKVRGQF